MLETPEHIRSLIIKFLQKEITDEEIDELRSWLEKDPTHLSYFDDINNSLQSGVTLGRLNSDKVDKAWDTLSKRIDTDSPSRKKVRSLNIHPLLKVAAVISLLIVAGYLLRKPIQQEIPLIGGSTVYHSKNQNTRVLLPDGTTVWLNADSKIEFDKDFDVEHRNVALTGEAFFDVTKSSSDFVVNTNHLSIHVKGTRFNVRAYADDQVVKTTLEEGKVELKVKGNDKLYSMQPGDQITFNSKKREIEVNHVDPADFSAWKEDKLIFDDTPLQDIILKLENRYSVDIVIEEHLAKSERLTMTIEHETIEEVLELIRLSSRLRYTINKRQILLYE